MLTSLVPKQTLTMYSIKHYRIHWADNSPTCRFTRVSGVTTSLQTRLTARQWAYSRLPKAAETVKFERPTAASCYMKQLVSTQKIQFYQVVLDLQSLLEANPTECPRTPKR